MGRVGEFTDYGDFFTELPAGIFVGTALFALAIIVLVVSSLFQILARKCCPDNKPTEIQEVVHVTNQETRRSFENPAYNNDEKGRHSKEQDITVRISQAPGYLAIENDDYENTSGLKKNSISDAEDYENLKDKEITLPKHISANIDKPKLYDNNIRRGQKSQKKGYDDKIQDKKLNPDEWYDRPKPQKQEIKLESQQSEDETPRYDVPKTFQEDTDDAPDYDVPKTFTG